MLDSPIVDYLPFLLDAYPNARLIFTHRDPAQWAARRARMHPCSPPPFAAWYGRGALALNGRPNVERATSTPGKEVRGHVCSRTPEFVLRHAFVAWTAYVESIAAALHRPLLHLDVYHESDAQLWAKLLRFLEVLPGARRRRRHAKGGFGCTPRLRRCNRAWRNASLALWNSTRGGRSRTSSPWPTASWLQPAGTNNATGGDEHDEPMGAGVAVSQLYRRRGDEAFARQDYAGGQRWYERAAQALG